MISQLEEVLFAQNWGKTSFEIREFQSPGLIAAGIEDQNRWKIQINYDPNLAKLDEVLSQSQLQQHFHGDLGRFPDIYTEEDHPGRSYHYMYQKQLL